MRRGRRPARHAAVRELMSRDDLAEPLDALQAAFDRWISGGSIEDLDAAIDALDGPLAATCSPLPDQADLTRDDKIRITAIRYRRAATVSGTLSRLAQAATASRDQALAEFTEACAVPPSIPVYGARFIEGLIAEGATQADLHPASQRRIRATLKVLRGIAPTGADGRPAPYLLPPVRQWSDLPREFAGYRLEDHDPSDDIGSPIPLPPYTDIVDYALDRMQPEEGATRRETYITWSRVLQRWADDQGNGPDNRPVQELDGRTSRAWVLLLGHRLRAPDEMPGAFDDLVITSPWDPGKAVKPAWIGDDVTSGDAS